MEIFCKRCGEADGVEPDDHDCIGNLSKKLRETMRRAEMAMPLGKWVPPAEKQSLFALEAELATIYENMRQVTKYFSDQVDQATRRLNAVYIQKQKAVGPLNLVRLAVKNQMIEVN